MQELGVPFEEREFSKRPLTAGEIREIAGSRSIGELINTGRQAYQELGFDQKPPTEEEALAAILANDNLLYRPIVIRGDRMILGIDEDAIRDLARQDFAKGQATG